MKILAIDPGSTHSAYCELIVGKHTEGVNRVLGLGKSEKVSNDYILTILGASSPEYDLIIIEEIKSYGMPIGQSVIDTCYWIGRFMQQAIYRHNGVKLVPRKEVKLHLCGSVKAKDSNVIQALVDRFAIHPEVNHGKGNKKSPDYFYGFNKDIWQAFALGIYYYDTFIRKDN